MRLLNKQQAKDALGVGTTVFEEYCNRREDPLPFVSDPLHPKIIRISEDDLRAWVARNFAPHNPCAQGSARQVMARKGGR